MMLTITLVCHECGTELNGFWHEGRKRYEVMACERCLAERFSEGFDAGSNEARERIGRNLFNERCANG